MEEVYKGCLMNRMGVSGWTFLPVPTHLGGPVPTHLGGPVPTHLGGPRQRAIKCLHCVCVLYNHWDYGVFHANVCCLWPLLHPFNSLFSRTTWVSQYQKGKTSLDLNQARDNGFLGCSGISWTTCKQSGTRQIATPTLYHSVFTGQMLFLTPSQHCQSTEGTMCCLRMP